MLMRLSLLNLQFTNLCKCTTSPVLKIAVLKFAIKSSIYKPMQFCGCWTWILNLLCLKLLLKL